MSERELRSGILLPEPDPDKGHPIVQLVLDCYPGCVVNILGDTPEDVEVWSQKIHRAQVEGQDHTLALTDPQYGQTCYLTPHAQSRVVLVSRAYARFVDAFALAELQEKRAREQELAALRPRGGVPRIA